MDPEGSDKTQLTFNALDDEHPAWSPDGRQIAFERDFDPIRGTVDYDLFTMHADGSGERRLTSSPGVQDLQADWSPDGERIAFLSDRDGDFEIYTMDPDGADVRQLTSNGADEFLPGWSPDGEAIVFTSDRDGNFEIYTTSPDGGTQTRLTFNDAGDGYPAWAPDGSTIVFASDRDGVLGASDLFTMRADGGDHVNLTRFPGWTSSLTGSRSPDRPASAGRVVVAAGQELVPLGAGEAAPRDAAGLADQRLRPDVPEVRVAGLVARRGDGRRRG